MKLTEIVWPIYLLGKEKPLKDSDVLFYAKIYKDKTVLEIVDDRTISSTTLAGRRVFLLSKDVRLYKINKALFFLADLIKTADKGTWYIDSMGNIFQYTKSKYIPLIFRKITKVIRSIGCTLIEIEGSNARLKTLFPPSLEEKYAGILVYEGSYIFYGYYETMHKPTNRKV